MSRREAELRMRVTVMVAEVHDIDYDTHNDTIFTA